MIKRFVLSLSLLSLLVFLAACGSSGGGGGGGDAPSLDFPTAGVTLDADATSGSFAFANSGDETVTFEYSGAVDASASSLAALISSDLEPTQVDEDAVSVTPTSGTITAGGSSVITVDIDKEGLAAGDYDLELVFSLSSDSADEDGEARVPLSFTVAGAPVDGPDLEIEPTSIDFGTGATSIEVILTNVGTEAAALSLGDITSDVEGAVSVTFESGTDITLEPEGTETATVTLDRSVLPDGAADYAASVGFSLGDDTETLDVAFSVAGGGSGPADAVDDSLSALGNTPLTIGAATLLANDTGAAISISEVDTSSLEGSLTEEDGGYVFSPSAGFTGSTSFGYTITGDDGTDSATVTIEVSNLVWYVDNSLMENGDGTLGSPLNSLAEAVRGNSASGAFEAGDTIFFFEGGGPYTTTTGNLVLLAGQNVVGQSVSLSDVLADIPADAQIPEVSEAKPVLSPGSGSGILINSGSTVAGVAISDTAVYGISSVAKTGVTIDSVDISGAAASCIDLRDSVDVTLSGLALTDCGTDIGDRAINAADLSGTAAFTDITITNAFGQSVFIDNAGGALDLTVEGAVIGSNQTFDYDAFEIDLTGDATLSVSVLDSEFTDPQSQGFQVVSAGTSAADITIDGTTINKTLGTLNAVSLVALDSSSLTYSISDSSITNSSTVEDPAGNERVAILIDSKGSSAVSGSITGSAISNTTDNGKTDGAIFVRNSGAASSVVAISGNTIETGGDNNGIEISSRDGTEGTVDATIGTNTITLGAGAGSINGVALVASGGNGICANMVSNTVNIPDTGTGLDVYAATGSTVELEGFDTSIQATWEDNGNTPPRSTRDRIQSDGSVAAGTCATVD